MGGGEIDGAVMTGEVGGGGWGWAEAGVGIIELKIRGKRRESQGRERFWEIDSVGVKVYNMES